MARVEKPLDRTKPGATDLESYRRLIELQKELVEQSAQYKLSKRQRDELFEVVVHEVAERFRRKSLRQRLQQSAATLLERPMIQMSPLMLRWRALLRRS